MTKPNEDDANWHLDKKVPITLIIALTIQTAGVVWWASALSGRVDALSLSMEELRGFKTSERLPVVEVQLRDLKEEVRELNKKIDTVIDRLPPR